MLRGGSSLVFLSITLNNNIVAILYKILDMGSRSHFIQNSLVWFCRNFALILPYCHTLHTFLRLIISKILQTKSYLSFLSPLCYSNIVALLYKKLDVGSRSVLVQTYKDSVENLTYVLRRCISSLNALDIGLWYIFIKI